MQEKFPDTLQIRSHGERDNPRQRSSGKAAALSAGQKSRKPLPVYAVLEGHTAIDENDGNAELVADKKIGVLGDVDFLDVERNAPLGLLQHLHRLIAETALCFPVDSYLVAHLHQFRVSASPSAKAHAGFRRPLQGSVRSVRRS